MPICDAGIAGLPIAGVVFQTIGAPDIEVELGTIGLPDIEITLAPGAGTMSGAAVYPLAALRGQDWVQQTVSGTPTWVRQIPPLTQRKLSLESGFSLLLESGGRLLLEP